MLTAELAENPLDLITPDQRERAQELAAYITEMIALPSGEFSVVKPEDSSGVAVVYAAELGLPWGSREWVDTFIGDTSEFSLDGEVFNYREGMTEGVYRAMITQVKDRCALPDRALRLTQDGHELFRPVRPFTWLTGEPLEGNYAAIGSVNEATGDMTKNLVYANQQSPNMRFRPAVLFE